MPASPLDLTTVASVKALASANGLASSNTSDDANIQLAITGFSLEFLRMTGQLGSEAPAQSPFVEPVTYNEWYNGNGNDQLFLKHRPIVSVSIITAGTATIPQSTGVSAVGWVIDQDQKSIVIRSAGCGQFGRSPGFMGTYGFPRGRMNVNVQYTAGYTGTPPDIEWCATVVVTQNWRRHTLYLDQASKSLGGAATIKFRDWELPPECARTVYNYSSASV
jgi:hypothetical protein